MAQTESVQIYCPCQPRDQTSSILFQAKRAEWLTWFRTGNPGSIWDQIISMLWNDVAYRIVNESRRLAEDEQTPRSAQNGLVGRLLDEGYISSQTLAIRRLLEPRQKRPDKQIISLKRAIDDMQSTASLITREAWVCADNMPYEAIEMHAANCPNTGASPYSSSERHSRFDELSGVSAANRKRQDTINPSYFDQFREMLDKGGCPAIVDYAHKFVAHSADSVSRSAAIINGVSMTQLTDAHKAIYQVAYILYAKIVGEAEVFPLPIITGDVFVHLEEPWATDTDKKALYRYWTSRENLTEEWRVEAMRRL